MMIRWTIPALLLCVFATAASVQAAEPYLEFLQGLRERRLYEEAIFYLDQIEAKDNTPAEVREVAPFERALILKQGAATLLSPEARDKQLDQALASLEQFVKASPNHPLAAQANTERARILRDKAKVEIWQSRSPANKGNEEEFRQQARKLIGQAREIFQTALEQHEAAWKSFGVFIDESADPERFQARGAAEVAFIQAQNDLALCTYQEAQTYDRQDPEFTKTLDKAAEEFETIHSRYRSMIAGLYARMYQGKCYEEQDEISKALGIYNELLAHPGRSNSLRILQRQVRQFRLICLNHEKKKDYQLVIIEVEEWLRGDGTQQVRRQEVGLGILWEYIRALVARADDRTLSETERNRILRQALSQAQFVNRFPGQYKDVSMFMIRDINLKLRGDVQDPDDFDSAFGLASNLVKDIKKHNDAIAAARAEKKPADEIAKLQDDLKLHLEETSRILNLALQLADDKVDLKGVNKMRYFLSYVYYLMDRTYESAVLGEFVGRRFYDQDPQIALESAYLAFSAFTKEFNAGSKGRSKDFEIQQMERLAGFIHEHWPQSGSANDARMNLGTIYRQMNRPAEAAQWFSQVPASAQNYSEAQTNAGQAYWSAYLNALTQPENERPPADELEAWQQAAEKHLRAGIEKTQNEVPQDKPTPPALTAAKVSLAQILVNMGQFEPILELMLNDPHPVMKAIAVDDEGKRPAEGVQGREFASLCYQLLLRSYIGTQQIDEALAAMKKLESIAGSSGGEEVVQIYVELGKKIEEEIRQLKAAGNAQRLNDVRDSFKTFLTAVGDRQEGQTYGSLFWIAETYYGLAQGSEDDAALAGSYFDKAVAAYQSILDRAAREGGDFVDADRLDGVKLRLVNCQRRQGDFEGALNLIAGVLETRPRLLKAQIEAAYVLQDWGAGGRADSPQKYLDAIKGVAAGPKETQIWGWAAIARQLQGVIQAGGPNSDAYRDEYFEARLNVPTCRHAYALAQSKTSNREAELAKALQELVAFATVTVDIDDSWKEEFNALYRRIQEDMGTPAIEMADLEWPVDVPETVAVTETETDLEARPAAAPAETQAQAASGPNYLLFALGVLAALGLTGGFVYLSMKPPAHRTALTYASAPRAASAGKKRPAAKTSTVKSGAAASQTRTAKPGKPQQPPADRP